MPYTNRIYIPAVTMPTVAQAVIGHDCEIDQLLFCNYSVAQVTVTVTDGNGKKIVAMPLEPGISQPVQFALPGPELRGQWCARGVQWFASAANSVDAHIMARDNVPQ